MRGLISAFRPWRGRHGGTLGQEVKQEAEAETMQAPCLQSCSQVYAQLTFLYKPGLPYEGMMLPTAGTVLLHQPPIKIVSHRHACRPALSETPLSGDSSLCQVDS